MKKLARLFVAVSLATVASALAADAGAGPSPIATASGPSPLADRKYWFCHGERQALDADERRFCPLVEGDAEAQARCPGFVRLCRDEPPASGRDEPPRARPPSEGFSPEAPGAFARVLLVLTIGALVAMLGYAVHRHLQERRLGRRGDDPSPDPGVREDAAEPEQHRPLTPGEAALRAAEAAAARGDHTLAVTLVRAGLLERLAREGLVELHPSLTDGDHVRALARHPELRADVAAVLRALEPVQFGGREATPSLYATVVARARPIVLRATALAALALALVGCGPSGSRERGPAGRGAVIEELARHGIDARRGVSLPEPLPDRHVLVLLPGFHASEEELGRIAAWVGGGGAIVLAGQVEGADALGASAHPGSDRASGPVTGGDIHPVLPPGPVLAGGSIAPDDVRLTREGRPYAAREEREEGTITMVADDALFTNAAVAFDGNVEALLDVVGAMPGEKVVVFDAPVRKGASTSFDTLSRAHATPLVLQGLVALLVAIAWKGASLGTRRSPRGRSRRAFALHAEALGALFARARATRHALGAYGAFVIDRLRKRSRRSALSDIAEDVAARTGRPVGEVLELLVEAHGARTADGPGDRDPQHLAVATKLAQLLNETKDPQATK